MSQYGPPSPPPDQPGPSGSYGWSNPPGPTGPHYGAPQPPMPNPYLPAAQPGTLPLRALTLSDYFSAMFATIRHTPGLFFGAALLFGALAAVISASGEFFFMRAFGSTALDPYAPMEQLFSGSLISFLGAAVLSQVVMFVGQTFNWGIYSIMIARSAIGTKTTVGQGFVLLRGQWGKLIGLIVLLVVALAVVYTITGVLIFLMIAAVFAGGEPESGSAIVAAGFGILGILLVPAIVSTFFLIRWQLVIPAMVIEDIGILAALRRSWKLTRGYFWRTLGIVLLFSLILGIVSTVITSPLTFLSGFILAAAGTEAQLFGSMMVITMLVTAITALVGFVITNMGVLISIFFYFDYRFRTEGLGLYFQQLAAQRTTDGAPDRFDTSVDHGSAAAAPSDDIIPGRQTTPGGFGQ